jgi:hypothetical protein
MSSGSDTERWGLPWADAVRGQLAGATCLWQDLDGLHVSGVPEEPPPTSILWGWRADGTLLRARLDSDASGVVAFIAELGAAEAGSRAGAVVPWDVAKDGRVAGLRRSGPPGAGTGGPYEQVVVDGIENGVGPVTFLRPAVKPRG